MFSLLTQRVSGSVLQRLLPVSASASAHTYHPLSNAHSNGRNSDQWRAIMGAGKGAVESPSERQWKEMDEKNDLDLPLGAYAGRTINVRDGNLARAFQELSVRLRQNKVLQEYKYQRRHEKKGDKRRRLQSERWRKHFANVVRQKVQLVHAIRRRGA